MTVQEFIWNAGGSINEHEIKTINGNHNCSLCKKEINEGVKSKKILSGNFTNHDVVSGEYLCQACANIMQSDLSTKLRRSNFIAFSDEIIYFKQGDIAKWIFSEKKTPFAIGITFSYKKHNAFRCMLNYSNENFSIRQEEKLIDINLTAAKEIFRAMLSLYLTYFTKDNIRLGDYNIAFVQKFGAEKLSQIENILKKHRKTDMFNLLIEALPSDKKLEYNKKIQEKEKEVKKNATITERKESCNIAVPNLEQHRLF